MLLVINSWPRKQIGEPEPSYQDAFLKCFCLAVTIAAMFGSVSYVIIHISELTFLEVGHMYIVILMSAVDIVSIYLFKLYATTRTQVDLMP